MSTDRIQPSLADAANVPPTPQWVTRKPTVGHSIEPKKNIYFSFFAFLVVCSENADFCQFVSYNDVKGNVFTGKNELQIAEFFLCVWLLI